MKFEKLNRKSVLLALLGVITMFGKVYGLYHLPEGFSQLADGIIGLLTIGGIVIDDSKTTEQPVEQNQESL